MGFRLQHREKGVYIEFSVQPEQRRHSASFWRQMKGLSLVQTDVFNVRYLYVLD
jgi:hypothetical protein